MAYTSDYQPMGEPHIKLIGGTQTKLNLLNKKKNNLYI